MSSCKWHCQCCKVITNHKNNAEKHIAGCEIPWDTPNQNMAMMMKVVRTLGKYPIRVS